MGTCTYCGQPAGFLRRKHRECELSHDGALSALTNTAFSVAVGTAESETLRQVWNVSKLKHAADRSVRTAIVEGWERAVERFFEDGVLDEEEERRLSEFQTEFGLTQEELDANGAYSKLVKGCALREIMNGVIPSRLRLEGSLPFNFQKGEQLVWVFQDVDYLEDKVRREYVGRSAGVSVRVAKGVYFRTGTFKGHPVERTERTFVARGLTGVTNKHVYFAGGSKSFRIRHDKIVSHMPFSDGVGVIRDTASARPQIFITGDGWFTYNLLSNVAQL